MISVLLFDIGETILDAGGRGAPSLSVTVTEESADFWEKHGFSDYGYI